jgi:hypothetical protein
MQVVIAGLHREDPTEWLGQIRNFGEAAEVLIALNFSYSLNQSG